MPPAKKSSCGKIILILAIILLLLGGVVAVAIYFGYQKLEQTLKSSEAYTVAVDALKANEEVKDQLGEITETGFPLGAYSQNADGSGNAAFFMSVQGTKGSGKYEVELVRSNSVWRLTRGVVRPESGGTIQVASGRQSTEDEPKSKDNTGPDIENPEGPTAGTTISGGVLNGKAVSLPKPDYPPIAKSAKASGTVVVQVLVDEKGNVASARAISGHPLLRAAAVSAARRAKFSPSQLNGKPARVSGTIRYEFTAE
jgi:TonB family protein